MGVTPLEKRGVASSAISFHGRWPVKRMPLQPLTQALKNALKTPLFIVIKTKKKRPIHRIGRYNKVIIKGLKCEIKKQIKHYFKIVI